MRLYAFTTRGLESVAAREIAARLDGATVRGTERETVHFDYRGDPKRLLRLGTTEDVFALVANVEVSRRKEDLRQIAEQVRRSPSLGEGVGLACALKPRKPKRISYRVIAQRTADVRDYRRVDVQIAVSNAIRSIFPKWKEVEDDAHVEIWARQDNRTVLCGVRLSDRTMRHRTYKLAHLEASLRPIVARSMVILSDPSDDDVFLDPMCGAGTILIERGEHGRYGHLLGGDIREEAVSATRLNVGPKYKPIGICRWDATRLPVADGVVSRIVCNLPFGKKIGSQSENVGLYSRFLDEGARVLKPSGKMVLLTSESDLLRRCVSKVGFHIQKTVEIEVLGQDATVFEIACTLKDGDD